MSDIVKRLEQDCYCCDLSGGECAPCQAREEIERLRANYELASAPYYKQLIEENERLREQAERDRDAINATYGVQEALKAEIKAMRDTLPPLIEDNERLRALLREHLLGPPRHDLSRQAHEWHEDYLKRVREELGDE